MKGVAHPDHGSYVLDCRHPSKDGGLQCAIDWNDPDEYDEVSSDTTQAVNFWCTACRQRKLCSTWIRERGCSDR